MITIILRGLAREGKQKKPLKKRQPLLLVRNLPLKILFQPVFFCEKSDTDAKLCNARTLGLDKRVRVAATRISDEKILAKVSGGGDLVALEARLSEA